MLSCTRSPGKGGGVVHCHIEEAGGGGLRGQPGASWRWGCRPAGPVKTPRVSQMHGQQANKPIYMTLAPFTLHGGGPWKSCSVPTSGLRQRQCIRPSSLAPKPFVKIKSIFWIKVGIFQDTLWSYHVIKSVTITTKKDIISDFPGEKWKFISLSGLVFFLSSFLCKPWDMLAMTT